MNWFAKHNISRFKAKTQNSPLNFSSETKTTDNPEGDPTKTQWGTEKLVSQNISESDWRQQGNQMVRDITTTSDYTQSGTKAGKTFKEAGVDPKAAKAYWAANPEEYKKYKESQNLSRQRQEVSKRQETKDLPAPAPEPKPVEKPFKPYKIQMNRGFANTDNRKGIGHPQFQTFDIDTPEKEASFKARIKNYEKMQDDQYKQLAPDHFGKTEKALQLAIKKNKERELARKRVASQVINLDTGEAYNPVTGMFEDQKDPNEAFAMNYGTPMKNLDTEGTFSYRQTKRIKN